MGIKEQIMGTKTIADLIQGTKTTEDHVTELLASIGEHEKRLDEMERRIKKLEERAKQKPSGRQE